MCVFLRIQPCGAYSRILWCRLWPDRDVLTLTAALYGHGKRRIMGWRCCSFRNHEKLTMNAHINQQQVEIKKCQQPHLHTLTSTFKLLGLCKHQIPVDFWMEIRNVMTDDDNKSKRFSGFFLQWLFGTFASPSFFILLTALSTSLQAVLQAPGTNFRSGHIHHAVIY